MSPHPRLKALGSILIFTVAITVGMLTTAHATIVGNQQVISLPIDAYNNQTQALLWLPDTYSTDSTSVTYPLIINLHGAGDAGTDINQLLNPGLLSRRIADGFKPAAVNPVDGQAYKFIVVSPHAGSWSYSYSNIKAMLPTIEANYRVDMNRIYITGLSAGGQGSWSAVTDDATNSINISAIAPMSAASLDSSQVPNVVNAATNTIGVWSVMGGSDSFLSSTQDYTNRVNAASPAKPALLTVLNGVGHSAWIEGFDDLWHINGMNVFEWMLTNKKGTPNPTNALPTVTLTAPTNNAVIAVSSPITLTAAASDSDGSIAKVDFYNGSTLLATTTTAPYTYTWANPGIGTYAVFARVTDNSGAVSNSDTARITVLQQTTVSAPFNGTPNAIPGTIQAEDYDIGGQNVAYSDTTTENNGNWYRPYESVDVELVPNEGSNQYYVGWAQAGEWMNYTVSVAQAGTYAMQIRAATPYTGKSFRVDVDGTAAATVTVPQTADLNTYQTTTVANIVLSAGTHVLKIYDITDGFNLNWMSFALSSNQLPTVNAGADQTITLPTNSAALSGTATDSDGTIASYAWSQVSGPNTATFATPSSAATSVSGLIAGTYTFRFSATDNVGGTASDDVVVVVNSNGISTPYTGGPYAIPGTIEAENFDNGGEGVAYHDADPANQAGQYRPTEGVDIENKTGGGYDIGWTNAGEWMKYTVNVAAAGSYALQLTTASPYGSTANVTFDVDGTTLITATMPQTTSFQDWKTFTAGTVTLPAGQHVIRMYENTTGFNIDSFSFTSTAPANNPPTANAGSDQSITLPTNTVTLTGSGTDTDGTIASYAWSFISGPVTPTIATTSAATTSVSNLTTAGTYTLRLTVTDNQGATGTDDVVITVNPAPNQAPTANAGVDQTITLPTSSVTLNGAGTDSDGTIASYAWSRVSGSGTITTSASATTTVTGLAQGVSVFRLTVTDNQGATGYDDVQITVNPAPQSPYGGTARSIPGTIQAEDFDNGGQNVAYYDSTSGNTGGYYRTNESVDIGTGDGGYIVGWTTAGEWTEYTVNVTQAGTYTLNIRAAVVSNNKSLRVDIDGTTVGTVTVTKTNSLSTYKTTSKTGIALTAGQHIMKIYNVTDGINLNWVSFN